MHIKQKVVTNKKSLYGKTFIKLMKFTERLSLFDTDFNEKLTSMYFFHNFELSNF